jgi:hypothetical protein
VAPLPLSRSLVFVLSVIAFAALSLAGTPTSSRQFHYPSALVAVCPDVGVALLLNDVLGLDAGGFLGDTHLGLDGGFVG